MQISDSSDHNMIPQLLVWHCWCTLLRTRCLLPFSLLVAAALMSSCVYAHWHKVMEPSLEGCLLLPL